MRLLTVTWSGPITLLLLALTIAGLYLGSQVTLKLSLTDLLPENHPAVVKFNKLTDELGGVGFFSIVLTAEDGKSHHKIAPEVIRRLKETPLIRNATAHREQRFFGDRMLYYLDLDKLEDLERNIDRQIKESKAKVFDLGLFDDDTQKKKPSTQAFDKKLTELAQKAAKNTEYLTSPDGQHLLIMAKPSFDSTDLGKTEALISFSQDFLKDVLPAGVTYRFGERYYNKVVETQLIQGDIGRLGLASIALILLVLFVYLRSWRAMVIIFAPVFMGLGITMGLTYLVIGHINIVTGFLIGILSGLGVDYSVHLFLRLRLERREPTNDEPDLFWRTISSTGHSIFVGAAAASVTFFLLTFSSFRAFSEFGFVCGTGIAAVFVCLVLSFTALCKFFRADCLPIPPPLFGSLGFPVIPIPKGLAAACIVTAGIMAMSSQIGFQYDFEAMMRHSKEMEATTHLINTVYDRSSSPAALSSRSKQEARDVEKYVREKYLPHIVSDVLSGATIVPEKQTEKQAVLLRIAERIKGIKDRFIEASLEVPAKAVRKWVSAQPFGFKDIPEHLQDALRGNSASGFVLYVYPAIHLSNAQNVAIFAAMMRDVEGKYPDLLSGSDAVIFSDILDLIKRDGTIILIVIFLSVGFFIWINTRRLDDTLASYLPLLISFVVGIGLMAIFGVQFNILNITIIPSFVALGIDVPIHIVHRARETGSGYKAVRDLAPSINLAMATAAMGFGILIFARAGVLKSLGAIALLGTAAIWWVGLWLLGAVLEWRLRKRRATQAAADVIASAPAKN